MLHAAPMPYDFRAENCRSEKSKGNTDLPPTMNLDDFGAPILFN